MNETMRGWISVCDTLVESKFQITVGDQRVTIYEEPPKALFHKLLAKYGELRGYLTDKLIVWDASTATHFDFMNATTEYGDALILRRDEIEIGSPEEDMEEDEPERMVEFAKNHESLIRLYGFNPPVVSRFR